MNLRLALAFFAALVLAAAAQETPAPLPATAPPVVEDTIANYGAQHPECSAWHNACALCVRPPDGKTACSTPGIACTPAEIICTDTRPK